MSTRDYAAYLHTKTDTVDKRHRLPHTICEEGTSLAQSTAMSLREALINEEKNFVKAVNKRNHIIVWECEDITPLDQVRHETCPMLSHLADQYQQGELIRDLNGDLVQSWADKDLSSLSKHDKEVAIPVNEQVKIVLVRQFVD